MTQVHYGVVKQDGAWTIIGAHLRVGRYPSRERALRAARRLAENSAGLPVQLHVQDGNGELRPAVKVVSAS